MMYSDMRLIYATRTNSDFTVEPNAKHPSHPPIEYILTLDRLQVSLQRFMVKEKMPSQGVLFRLGSE